MGVVEEILRRIGRCINNLYSGLFLDTIKNERF